MPNSISATSKVIRHMKDIATIVRNMDIEPLNVDPNPRGHQTSQ